MYLLTLTTRPGRLGGPEADKPEVDVIDLTWNTAVKTANLLDCAETTVSYTQAKAEVSSSDFDVFIRIDAPTYQASETFQAPLDLYADSISTFPTGWRLRVGVWINTSTASFTARAGQLVTTPG